MKKLISVFILLILLTGCTKKNELDKISNAIINYHHEYNYNISNLSSESQKVLENLKKQELKENKVINISKLDVFSNDITTDEPNTKGVYYENGDYLIKYNDLKFEKVNEKDYIATLYVNGYIVNISKRDFPILYYETRSVEYKYRFMKKVKENNEIKYYYRSYGNGSMLTIDYKMNNDKIESIDLLYSDYYILDNLEPEVKHSSNFGNVVFMVVISLAVGFTIFKALKIYK